MLESDDLTMAVDEDTVVELEPGNKRRMFSPPFGQSRTLTAEERREKRKSKKKSRSVVDGAENGTPNSVSSPPGETDHRFAALLARREDDLLHFVAKVNKVYQELLGKPAPFMTFVFCGMQSAGKSTIMERFLGSVLNIIQEGTGTRCPLDTTCIHDDSVLEPVCELFGEELPEESKGSTLSVSTVFERITEHNKMLASEDRFSVKPISLVYRSKDVQNMRFVDTPGKYRPVATAQRGVGELRAHDFFSIIWFLGIISNMGTGNDNREDIKVILRSEMRKPNTRLCVLLEPKEFATNPIIEFCDDSLGGRGKWLSNATFLMTKFDKQLEDSRTGSKANSFFNEFFDNLCFPHLVMTPTLARENLPMDKLFKERLRLLEQSDEYEKDRFEMWQEGHERLLATAAPGEDEPLHEEIQKRIGFATAKKAMREIMLKDTVERLPEVLSSLRTDLDQCEQEKQSLLDRQQFTDSANLKLVVNKMLFRLQERILNYLDGDLELAKKFPGKLQTLEEEVDDEEESDWRKKTLNFHSEKEDLWRDRIANLDEYPEHIQPDAKFLGGKQYQRAIEFFKVVMIDALPDPFELKDLVATATGYLSGGLQRENWERAMVEVTRVSLRDVSHPGINYLIKHVGSIFRRFFAIAMEDIKHGSEFSAEFKLMPTGIERFLAAEYDDMLWSLLEKVSMETHSSLEPMYSTIDPNLPTFHPNKLETEPDKQRFYLRNDQGGFVEASKAADENYCDSIVAALKNKVTALISNNGSEAKQFLKHESVKQAKSRKNFLSDERSAMLTAEETNMILKRSFEYIVALLEFNLIVFKFQLNHHLYRGFKEHIRGTLIARVNNADWDSLVQPDPLIQPRIEALEKQIKGLSDSLREVQRMQRTL